MFSLLRWKDRVSRTASRGRKNLRLQLEGLEARDLLSVITLDFDSLPSSQGWTYVSGNRPESSIFSVDGTMLTMNSLGTGFRPTPAYHYYEHYNAVDPSQPFTISARVQVVQSEGFDSDFMLIAQVGTRGVGVGIGTHEIWEVLRTGGALLSTAVDGTQFHNYRLDANPTTGFQLYVDEVFIGSGPWADAAVSNRLQFGDGTMDGNSLVKITQYEFRQGIADIAPASLTWNTAQGGVDFSYQITGADLPQATTAAFYWATGTTFDDRIGDPVFSTPLEQVAGTYGPVHVSAADLGTPPPEATHLLVVTDPDDLIAETDETNNVLAQEIPAVAAVDAVTVNDGATQRSMVNSLTVTFSSPVLLDPGAFDVVRQGGGSFRVDVSASVVDGHTVAVLTFAGDDIIGGSLADGTYTLTVRGDHVHDALGRELDGDRVDTFFRLFGDTNGDGAVTRADLDAFIGTYGKSQGEDGYLWYLDYNGDGTVDYTDWLAFRDRLPPF